MAKILLVEDDPILGKSLKIGLEVGGHSVIWEMSLRTARQQEQNCSFDLILLDVNLPDGLGFDFCSELRSKNSRIPIIMLTARSDEDSVIEGLRAGANDYVRKPFGMRELLERIRVAIKEPTIREEQVRYGPILILKDQRRVLINEVEVEFNRREFDILSYLIERSEAVVSREELIHQLAQGEEIFDRTIDSHISHIRSKLKKLPNPVVHISSVYGVGYRVQKHA